MLIIERPTYNIHERAERFITDRQRGLVQIGLHTTPNERAERLITDRPTFNTKSTERAETFIIDRPTYNPE